MMQHNLHAHGAMAQEKQMVDEVEFDIMDADDQSRSEDDFSDNFDYDQRAAARKKAGRKLSDNESDNNNLLNADFYVGQSLYWVHGEHHRTATVTEVEENRVRVIGLTSKYWISKESLMRKINKPYQYGRAVI